ncbi:protein kinase domain-containing protein [Pelagibius marinus]|uniref:protein kinase domain-containing protein n=1 Tax=Pelagibius marinus TaxID=2762760 RepID=UPI0018723F9B|nr:protein kinase [Pelagibius marinus]
MISDLLGEEFLQDIVTASLKEVVGIVVPGSHIALALVPHVSRAFFMAYDRYKGAERQEAMDSLARVPFSRSYDIAARSVAASGLDEDQQAELVKYLSAIPMTSRQALRRSNDGGHVTTLLSQLPRNPEQMARFVPLRPPRFRPGDKVAGHDLRLDTLLGQGGFAEVWKAHNIERPGEPPLALKFCLDADLLVSLKRETGLVDRLQRISPEKDFVQLRQNALSAEPPFLVYEYMAGGNLANWLEGFEGKPPPPKEVVSVLKMAARAVAVAHEHGIVHRDLKPANLMVDDAGRVKVADFGIGALMADSEAGQQAGQSVGSMNPTLLHGAYTPVYTDPLRERFAPATPQDDVYALGVVGYQLLVGNVAWPMDGGWRRHLEARDVPAPLIEVLDSCVAPADQRYVDAGALLAALEDPPAVKKPKPAPEPEPAPVRPRGSRRPPRPDPAVKFCHRCGSRLQPGNRFCTNCGYRVPEGGT